MAYQYKEQEIGREAGEDLTEYRFIKLDSGTAKVIQCDSAGERAIGITENSPSSGEDADLTLSGISKVEAGGSFNPNDTVGTDANGKAVSGASTDLAVAMESSGGDGEIVPIKLID